MVTTSGGGSPGYVSLMRPAGKRGFQIGTNFAGTAAVKTTNPCLSRIL